MIKHKKETVQNGRYYNPAVEGFKKYCRTSKTIGKNLKLLKRNAQKADFVSDYFIQCYEGKYEDYKPTELLCIYEKEDIN